MKSHIFVTVWGWVVVISLRSGRRGSLLQAEVEEMQSVLGSDADPEVLAQPFRTAAVSEAAALM